ncbi:MAG: fumarylacetoacetate hydrolase family protein [Candidatus Dormibacteraeota bacterium]|jgi:2-keto-4-pentenoate hydratase/2-oxohepta-3-ene-1,7-dioic acid hydratase in catechol pathway|nr:fumarylacetoacetate hydrolase family protein [Candidatus Dormibacteraeota bacterium]
MRLVSYLFEGAVRAGVEQDDRVLPAEVLEFGRGGVTQAVTVRELLRLGPQRLAEVLDSARSLIQNGKGLAGTMGELHLVAALPDPDKILCLGQNYSEHVAEMGSQRPAAPNIFAKFRNGLVGSGEPIRLPEASAQVDYEGELAVVMGRRCSRVSPDEAMGYVGGYTVMNDVSARDLQFRTGQYTIGKAVDTFCPLGPGIVPAAEVEDPQRLGLVTRLNGEVMQNGNTADMLFSIAESISFISQVITLECGDVIATGTPAGVGYKRVPPRFLRPGDLIEVEVEGVGRLSNPVVKG